MKPVIIIGTGLAGYTLAREFRKLDKNTPLFILTADNGGFYSKPMLSNAFAQGKRAEQLVTQTAVQMAGQLSATIMTGTRVAAVDTRAKTVETSSGTFPYDKLVLAVGAQPIRLAINGDAAEEVLSVNHIDDYAQFRQRLGEQSRVAILGAGLIGCEFADDLAGARHRVAVIDPNERPLAALASPALSHGLQGALTQRGVQFCLGTTVTRVERKNDALGVALADGRSLEADVVLSAVGLRPDLRLAHASGLDTGRGIVVDAQGRTSAPDVFALGDCTEYTTESGTRVLPYVAPIMAAARAIARTLSGEATDIALNPSPVIVKTLSFPLALMPPPTAPKADGAWHETRYGERVVCRYYNGEGTMVGFGVAPQEASIRQSLLAELGSSRVTLAA
ncbi:NAD(P)/FAD-dependent oxidoreductase [Noviherbaspirillum sp. ST9]|uniref:NAD(P)/FAD-dependent oxidoreductase n=1 Tax=Noviherbaspirillum sp. ST9 TaxID=3401606 RepID=UPI003B586F01